MFDYKNAEKILEAEDVVVKFNLRGKTLTAIRGISMELYKGESLAIVGESGSGKSVFTKTFMGLLDQNGWVDSGSIIYSGGKYTGKGVDLVPMKTEKEWLNIRGKEIAMVFQDPMTSLNPLKTIGKQIQETVELHQNLKGEEAKKKTIEILEDVGIAEPERRYKQYPHEFSGGMRQRVVIAIAGMEGALASVISGLADCPVIAVPTSVGYGASFGGVAALLAMLNSCASGVSVVNIDNGFGAGYLASMINHMEAKHA